MNATPIALTLPFSFRKTANLAVKALSAVAIAFSVHVGAQAQELTDWAKVQASGVLTVAVYNYLAPYSDQGKGIPEEEREKVFERFHTAEKGDWRRSGSGLGLTICQGMIMAHGGKVSIHANPRRVADRINPGCCVRIELPITESDENLDQPTQ